MCTIQALVCTDKERHNNMGIIIRDYSGQHYYTYVHMCVCLQRNYTFTLVSIFFLEYMKYTSTVNFIISLGRRIKEWVANVFQRFSVSPSNLALMCYMSVQRQFYMTNRNYRTVCHCTSSSSSLHHWHSNHPLKPLKLFFFLAHEKS